MSESPSSDICLALHDCAVCVYKGNVASCPHAKQKEQKVIVVSRICQLFTQILKNSGYGQIEYKGIVFAINKALSPVGLMPIIIERAKTRQPDFIQLGFKKDPEGILKCRVILVTDSPIEVILNYIITSFCAELRDGRYIARKGKIVLAENVVEDHNSIINTIRDSFDAIATDISTPLTVQS